MDYYVQLMKEEYTGLLAFISEELLDKKFKGEIQGFHLFRYLTNVDKTADTEHVRIEIRGATNEFNKHFRTKLHELKKKD
jgi:hypothetical protein